MVTLDHTVAYCQRMANLSTTDWVTAAFAKLRDSGVDAVRIERLAKELGVSKGSFYWHFSGRDELLAAVLEGWRTRGTRDIIATVDDASSEPRERITALARAVYSFPQEDGFEVGVRAWAQVDARARAAVTEVDATRIAYVASLLEMTGNSPVEARLRAEAFYRTLLGEFLMRHYGTPPTDQAALDRTAVILLLAE